MRARRGTRTSTWLNMAMCSWHLIEPLRRRLLSLTQLGGHRPIDRRERREPLSPLGREDLEVSRCSLLAPREAVAGVASLVETKCCDSYGNEVAPDVLAGHAPSFGLLLVPALLKGASGPTGKDGRDVEEKRDPNKGDHVDEKRRAALLKKEERANLVKTLDTMSFHGSWDGSRMIMSFVCPKRPATLSCMSGASVALLTAGDKLALKVQICDEFNNFVSLASASDMTSMLETPIGQLALIQKTSE
eukprot:jgi/Chrpa1/26311/Chrysochromulina_OHIO_Genome00025298-RA